MSVASPPVKNVHRAPRLSRPVAFGAEAVTFAALYVAAGAPTPLLVVFQREWGFPAWVLTIAFAVYAIALLSALLVVGSLSDFVGRRPVLTVALAVELVAMLMFLLAPNIGWIIAARALQGAATGAATTAFSASLLDLAPDSRKGLASVINGTAPAGGLAVGALLAGIAVDFTANADVVVFVVLAAVIGLGTVAAAFSPGDSPHRPGAARSLVPHASVAPRARAEFAASVPVHIAAWMLAGLFMGLVPTILALIFDVRGGTADGFTAFLEPGAAAIAGVALGRVAPRVTVLVGGAAVLLGAATITCGVLFAALPVLWIGGIVGGIGFGASFSGALRVIAPVAESKQRAELFAAIYVVAYLSFGLPVIVAGQFIAPMGLLRVVIAYAVTTGCVAVVGLVAQAGRLRAGRIRRKNGASDLLDSFAAELADASRR